MINLSHTKCEEMGEFDKNRGESGNNSKDGREDEVYSKVVKAGKRTYFLDIKSTRRKDLYLTITESKKQTSEYGKASYQKHKIFLYKEDIENFKDGLEDVINQMAELRETGEYLPLEERELEFEDLG